MSRIRAPNAYLRYRIFKIDPEAKSTMADHSKKTGTDWENESDSQKREYFQAAAKDSVTIGNASGGNGLTKKTCEQNGNFLFINETPIQKERETDQNSEHLFKKSNVKKTGGNNLNNVYKIASVRPIQEEKQASLAFNDNADRNFNQHLRKSAEQNDKEFVPNEDTNYEDLFKQFTMGTDFQAAAAVEKESFDTFADEMPIQKKRTRSHREAPKKVAKLKSQHNEEEKIFEDQLFNGVPPPDKN